MAELALLRRSALAAVVLLLVFVSAASAQFNTNPNPNSLPNQMNNGQNLVIPSPIVPNGQLTPQQMQSIMMMRAMGGRRNNVRTGYPQMVPQWGPGAGMPSLMPADDQPATAAATGSSSQKRAEAKRQRDEQKKAAREAKGKGKGKTDKVVADKPAKSDRAEKAAKAKADRQAKADKKAGKKAADKNAPEKD